LCHILSEAQLMGLKTNGFYTEADRPLALQEYLIVLEDSQLQGFIKDTRLKGVCSRTNCEVVLTKRILNRRFSHRWMKYAVIQVIGMDAKSIQKCNLILEKTFPWYINRKEYSQRAPVRIFTSEITPDNTDLCSGHQRTGTCDPFFYDLRVRSPHEIHLEDIPFKPWSYLQRQFEGTHEPQQESIQNYMKFRVPKTLGCAEKYTCRLTRQLIVDDTKLAEREDALSQNEGVQSHNDAVSSPNMNLNSNSLFLSDFVFRGSFSTTTKTQTVLSPTEAMEPHRIFRNLHNNEEYEDSQSQSFGAHQFNGRNPVENKTFPKNSVSFTTEYLRERNPPTPILEIDNPHSGLQVQPIKMKNTVFDLRDSHSERKWTNSSQSHMNHHRQPQQFNESWWQNNSSSCGKTNSPVKSSYCFMKNGGEMQKFERKSSQFPAKRAPLDGQKRVHLL
jgi:hypothetical protein